MFTKIKLAVMFALLVFLVSSANANTNFKIEDYKTEKFSDFMLNVEGELSGSSSKSENGSEDLTNYFNTSYKRKSSYYGLRLNSRMSYLKKTLAEDVKSSVYISTNFTSRSSDYTNERSNGGLSQNSNIDHDKTSQKLTNIYISPKSSYKKYFKRDNFYSVELGGTFNYEATLKDKIEGFNQNYILSGFYNNYNKTKIDRDRNRDSRSYVLNSEVAIGNGREYIGKFAFTVHNIIEELRKKGLLVSEPDKEQMIALTDIIYQFENSHTIDARLKEIEKFDKIYSFLLKHKIVEENNHLGMLLVHDAFKMFPVDYRSFGFSKSIGVGVKYSYNSSHESTDEKSTRLYYQYYFNTPHLVDTLTNESNNRSLYNERKDEELLKYVIASITYSKPINMKWQLNANCRTLYYFDSYDIQEVFDSELTDESYATNLIHRFSKVQKKYDINSSLNIDYYYNSRTTWRSSLSYNYNRFKADYDDFDNRRLSKDETRWNFNLHTSLEYRLSIPTTLKGYIRYVDYGREQAYETKSQNIEDNSVSFSLSIAHFIY